MIQRIDRLENRLQVGTNRDGTCRYCTGREKQLGGRYVTIDERPLRIWWDGTRKPPDDRTPTPCPRCGKDMNTYVIIQNVDMIARRRAEMGLPPYVPIAGP